MRTMILTLAAIGLFSTTSHAALSGYYDSAAKIQVALDSSELANAMEQRPIEALSIENGGSTIVVQSNGCGYAVHLTAQAPVPGRAGSTTYTVDSVVGPMCTGAVK